jgi:hypothetical protein
MKLFGKISRVFCIILCLQAPEVLANDVVIFNIQTQVDTTKQKHKFLKSISPKALYIGAKNMLQKTDAFLAKHEVSIGPSGSFNTLQDVYIYDMGVQLGFKIKKGLRLNLDATYRSDFQAAYIMHWGSVPIDVTMNNRSTVFSSQFDWFPLHAATTWRPLKSLKILAGTRWVSNPNYASTASLHEPLIFGEYVFEQEEIGSVRTQINTKKFQPYFGLGIDPTNNRKRVNLGIQGGILYQGKPTVNMQANNMVRATVENAPVLEKELASFQFIPFFKVFTHINF